MFLFNSQKLNNMKKTYIIPSTTSVSLLSGIVCQVGSVHGGTLNYGGGAAPGGSVEPI